MRLKLVAAVFLVHIGLSTPLFACKCAVPPPDPLTGQRPAPHISLSNVVFEGKVESATLKWDLINAKSGDLVASDLDADPPAMLIGFHVIRNYHDADQEHLSLQTGVGGGDCGYDFEIGKQYLVEAFRDQDGSFSTNICTSTGPLEENQEEIAHLNGEPLPQQPARPAAPKGRLCGQLVLDNSIHSTEPRLFLFRKNNKSPVPNDEIEVGDDRSFCGTDVAPGHYFLLFQDGTDETTTSLVFFPGVTERSYASEIEVRSDSPISHLLFKVPPQQKYKVEKSRNSENRSEELNLKCC